MLTLETHHASIGLYNPVSFLLSAAANPAADPGACPADSCGTRLFWVWGPFLNFVFSSENFEIYTSGVKSPSTIHK